MRGEDQRLGDSNPIRTLTFSRALAPARIHWNNAPAHPLPTGVQHCSFLSESNQTEIGFNIYLPPDAPTSQRRYPVIYHLHGIGGNENSEVFWIERLDAAIRAGRLSPVIVVFANGLARSAYADSKNGRYRVETAIVRELIPYVDAHFRTQARPEGRGIQGFSMGGSGALLYATKYPRIFSSCVTFSAPLNHAANINPWARRQMYGNDDAYGMDFTPWKWAESNARSLRKHLRIWQIVGARDSATLKDNNTRFGSLLAANRISSALLTIDDCGHDLACAYERLDLQPFLFHRSPFEDSEADAWG